MELRSYGVMELRQMQLGQPPCRDVDSSRLKKIDMHVKIKNGVYCETR